MVSDDVAAVVIGRNESRHLLDCLTSIQPSVKRIVYVDSGSSDGSVEIAERFGARVVNLDAGQPFTAARARNEGFAVLKKLRPDIRLVQFIDGDCELDSGWLNTAAEFIRKRNDIAVVCGRRRERHPSASVYNRLCDLEWDTPAGQTTACGGDSLVRVEAFEAVGGFQAQLIAGEEPELCLRLRERGWKIWRLDVDMTRHDAAMMQFGQWWSRAVRFGYGTTEVSVLHWHSPLATWKAQLARAVFWGGMLPALMVLAALVQPLVLLAVLIYPIQIFRLAIVRGPTSSTSWAYGFFVTLGKFPEFQGVLKYCWHKLRGQSSLLIEYR